MLTIKNSNRNQISAQSAGWWLGYSNNVLIRVHAVQHEILNTPLPSEPREQCIHRIVFID